jgi:hypothetical protein
MSESKSPDQPSGPVNPAPNQGGTNPPSGWPPPAPLSFLPPAAPPSYLPPSGLVPPITPTSFPPLSPPPIGPAPTAARPRSSRRGLVAVIAAAVAVAVTATVLVLPIFGGKSSPAAPAPSGLVTAVPEPQPTTAVVLTTGGDVGKTIDFTTSTGAGQITITQITWAQAGRMAPPAGSQYLIADVHLNCTQGAVQLSTLSLVAGADPASSSRFGPDLKNQLSGVELKAGKHVSGQIGFVLPAGQTQLTLQDARLASIATARIPGP